MDDKPKISGCGRFTLIELLIVVAVIAILATMLLPALAQAKERSKRIVCMANLKSMGTMAITHAADWDRWLPQAYGRKGASRPYASPFDIRYDGPGAKSPAAGWKAFGTTWAIWEDYGMSATSVDCPSSAIETTTRIFKNSNAPGWDPSVVRMSHYVYLAGLPARKWGSNRLNWHNAGLIRPAGDGSIGNLNPTDLLAADMAFRHSTNSGTSFNVSHSQHKGGVDFQSHLFVDGHVEGISDDGSLSYLTTSASQFGVKDILSAGARYWYWAEAQ